MNKESRFELIEKDDSLINEIGEIKILMDKDTGVCYIWVKKDNSIALTPMMDIDGKPILSVI